MIKIYGIKEKLNPIKAQLSDIIQLSMNQGIGLSEDMRAHRFIPLDKDNFYYPTGHSDDYIAIEIHMMRGRQRQTIKKLIHTLFQNIEKQLHISPMDIEITIHEQPTYCWGFRGMTGDEVNALNYKIHI